MQQSTSSKVFSRSAGPGFPTFHCLVHENTPLDLIINQLNPPRTLTPYLFKILPSSLLHLVLPRDFLLLDLLTKIQCAFLISILQN